jgi:predicted secreted protein
MTAIKNIERAVLIILLLSVLATSNARGDDNASRSIIGFSTDGRYFAFEQYGIWDGMDGAYAEILIIDSRDSSSVPGTPISKSDIDETFTLAKARKVVRDQARRLLTKLRISEPGDHLASNPLAELSADPFKVVVNATHRISPRSEQPVSFTLAEKPLASAQCSKVFKLPMKGFTLTMVREGAPPITLHDDTALPASRGCALGYAIADVMAYEAADGQTTYAVLLHVSDISFDGTGSSFLAVTRRLP